MKVCTQCKRELCLSSFHKMSKTQDGLAYKCKGCKHSYYRENNERLRKVQDKYYAENKDEINFKRRQLDSYEIKKRDVVSHYFYNSLYNMRKLNATPTWLTEEHLSSIRQVYQEAIELSVSTGVKHHVDHIYPLKGKTICGLHVPWNLRAIPALQNLTKGNSFP